MSTGARCIECGARANFGCKRCPEHSRYGKKGRSMTKNGYWRVWKPDHPLARCGFVLEHRMVVHDAGIAVPPGAHVHHLNGDKADNRLENLEVLAAGDHHRHHMRSAGFVVNQYGTWPVLDAYKREEAA